MISPAWVGGWYENTCQKMLWAGIKYMEKTSDFTILDGRKTYQHFYGIVDTPESFKECREEMIKVAKSWTGAMMQCVTGHLQFIAEKGLETWRKELRKSRG